MDHPLRTDPAAGVMAAARAALLAWYDETRRDFPWRAPPGERADPYRVWLSEIMLQQTTTAAAAPYFEAFVQRWPGVKDLAAAALDDVIEAWAGLGYYRRARFLHAAAQAVMAKHGGRFPDMVEDLRALPGVGAYTAAAVAAIAFDRDVVPVDGNVERVTARFHRIEDPLPAAKPAIERAAQDFRGSGRPGDMAQALMDLGARVCTPTSPSCLLCPLRRGCAAHAAGVAADLPKKTAKRKQVRKYAVAFVARAPDGRALMRRRPETGVLAGLWEAPSSPWEAAPIADASAHEPFAAEWEHRGAVAHVFTHIRLAVEVYAASVERASPQLGVWRDPRAGGLPTLTKKVLEAAGVRAAAQRAAPKSSART